MVATRRGLRQVYARSRLSVKEAPIISRSRSNGHREERFLTATTWEGSTPVSDSASSVSSDHSGVENRFSRSNTKRGSIRGANNERAGGNTNTNAHGSSSSSSSSAVMTRKRRLLHEVEAHLAFGVTPYWEGSVDLGGDTGPRQEGTAPRRSRRGEARRKYEDAAGLLREHLKMEVNLPPMVSTREGKLLAVEVFGSGVLGYLPAGDGGSRVGHCSSGYVCGYPVPRGKEGNSWCQTPVRASLENKLACKHHSHRRTRAAGPSTNQLRYMMLADEFYDQQTGDICWKRVVSFLRRQELPVERGKCRQVLTVGGRAVAVADTKIVLHGFVQCLFFWLAACRLTRRGYKFTMVAHASKTEFKEFLAGLRNTTAWPPPSPASSPFVCLNDKKRSLRKTSYYASGYDEVCRMF
ncbi:unnamed protein product [Pylaiella littoralis]